MSSIRQMIWCERVLWLSGRHSFPSRLNHLGIWAFLQQNLGQKEKNSSRTSLKQNLCYTSILLWGMYHKSTQVAIFVYFLPFGGDFLLPGHRSVAWPQIVHFKTVWGPDGLPLFAWSLLAEGERDPSRPFSQIPYQYQSSDGDCLKRVESSPAPASFSSELSN